MHSPDRDQQQWAALRLTQPGTLQVLAGLTHKPRMCACRSYLDISRQAGDQEMQGRACVAYADCQHKLGQLDGAVESLETFLQISHSQVTMLRGRAHSTGCLNGLSVFARARATLPQGVSNT